MSWFKEVSNLSVFIILFAMITSSRCDSLVSATEGGAVQLHFPYPCNSTIVTLQYGNRLPFYSSEDPEFLTLNTDQSKRFTVGNASKEGKCSLQLSITPVTRTDAGTYMLLAYINDYVTRVGLHVEFHPGKTQCEWNGRYTARGWVRLHCSAPVGSMPGQIQCYQDGLEMPPLSTPLETLRTLEQTILARENHHPAFCCSSPLIEPKERCDCNDFEWDPISRIGTSKVGDPCPASKAVPTISLSTSSSIRQEHTSVGLTARPIIATKDQTRCDNDHANKKKMEIVLIVSFAMMMVMMFLFMIYWALSKHMHPRSNAKEDRNYFHNYFPLRKMYMNVDDEDRIIAVI